MSTAKFKARLTGRAGIEYSEGSRQMTIDSELLAASDNHVVVFGDSIRAWDPPHDTVPVNQVDIMRIRTNLEVALKPMRIEWQ